MAGLRVNYNPLEHIVSGVSQKDLLVIIGREILSRERALCINSPKKESTIFYDQLYGLDLPLNY